MKRTTSKLPFDVNLQRQADRLGWNDSQLAESISVGLSKVGLGKTHRVKINCWRHRGHIPSPLVQQAVLGWLAKQRAKS